MVVEKHSDCDSIERTNRRHPGIPILPFSVLGGIHGLLGCGERGKEPVAGKEPVEEKSAPAPVDTSAEREVAYAIEIDQSRGPVRVGEDWRFHSGDRCRILFRPGFDAYVYVVNRGPRQMAYQMLFPSDRIAARNPIPAGSEVRVPGAETAWLHMDEDAGDENLILIASTAPFAEFDGMAGEVGREDFEAKLAKVERKRRPASSRRFEDKDWVKLFAARGKEEIWRSCCGCRCCTNRRNGCGGEANLRVTRCRKKESSSYQ